MREMNNNIDHKHREDGLAIIIDDFFRYVEDAQENHWRQDPY
jgi:hypothetical protein